MKYNNDLYVKHLQGVVQFPTVSNVDPDKLPTEEFLKMHAYLEEAFPLIHKTLEKEIMGKAALVYHWKGTGKSNALPLVLIAHQDVVPEGDWAKWNFPPFSGHVDEEGLMVSRGCTDCKNTMIYEMEAVEALIAEGFVPDYDIYLCFGYNEEIMGGPGAACEIIVNTFKERGIQIGMLFDEGGGLSEKNGQLVASVKFSEKGYADYEFYVEQNGGHAMMPPLHNSLGILGKAMYDLEANRMDYFLSEPAKVMMQATAKYQDAPLDLYYSDPEKYFTELCALAENNPYLNSLLRTTTTPTMASGSAQANILPEKASVITNSRILPGQTLEDLEAHFRKVLPEEVKFRKIKGHNPPIAQSVDNKEFELLSSVVREKYPDAVILPAFIAGSTDSRYYCEICPTKAVYGFVGGFTSSKSKGAHAVNETLDTRFMESAVEFFVRIIQGYGK